MSNGRKDIVREKVTGKTCLSLGLTPENSKNATHVWSCHCEKTVVAIESTWKTPWLTYCYCDDCSASHEFIDNYMKGHSGLAKNF